MRLRSRITPRHTDQRNVSFHGKQYQFTRQANGQFEADVDDERHAKALVKTGDFFPADAKLRRGGKAPDPETDPGNPAETDTGDGTAYPEDVQKEAAALVAQNVEDIGAAIGKVSSLGVVACARSLEATGSKRTTALKLLDDALEHAKQAGLS